MTDDPAVRSRRPREAGARLLLVDDDVELAALLSDYLRAEGFHVDTLADGDAIDERLDRYDVLILDVMLPGLSGIDILRRIRRRSTIPVVMLTARGSNVDRVAGLDLGADDYIAKPCYPPELVARIRAVLRRGGDGMDGPRYALGSLSLSPDLREARVGATMLDLTASEFNLLAALLTPGDRVVDREELSHRVLGRAREAYDRSIDVHVSNLRHKLAAAGAREIVIETIRGVGYRLHAL